MEIHYFAAARAAAGTAVDNIDTVPPTLGELLDALAHQHDGTTDSGLTLAGVLDRCTFLVDGARVDRDAVLGSATRVDVLPPFAGG